MAEILLATEHHSESCVRIEPGIHLRIGEMLHEFFPAPRKVVLLSDRNVAPLWAGPVEESLAQAGYELKDVLIPPGEEAKSLTMLGTLWDRCLDFGLDRSSVLVALGGGVVGDLGGFAAATLQRGIAVVQIPSTLLAQVDSSVGGKTGINRSAGKNLVGAFLQPRLVLVDPTLLGTLSDRQFRAGLAEVIKAGFIRDPRILSSLEDVADLEQLRADPDRVLELVERSVRMKAEVVQQDERERGVRAHLNFGHTIGHALEAADEYRGPLHGEAVAIGMVAACFLAVDLGLASPDLVGRMTRLLERFELPVHTPHSPADLLPFIGRDKKRQRGKSRWIVVPEIGRAEVVEDPPEESVFRALEAIQRS